MAYVFKNLVTTEVVTNILIFLLSFVLGPPSFILRHLSSVIALRHLSSVIALRLLSFILSSYFNRHDAHGQHNAPPLRSLLHRHGHLPHDVCQNLRLEAGSAEVATGQPGHHPDRKSSADLFLHLRRHPLFYFSKRVNHYIVWAILHGRHVCLLVHAHD